MTRTSVRDSIRSVEHLFALEVVAMVRWGAIAALCLVGIAAPAVMRPHVGSQAQTAVVVRPGDTLWDHARRIAPPGGDIRATVDELARVNGIDPGRTLLAGSRLALPSGSSLTARVTD